MTFQNLTELEFFEGILGLIWVIIALLVSFRIFFKAIKLKRSELWLVGMTYICISSAWWGVAGQFIVYGCFSYRLSPVQYLFLANIFIPIGLGSWGWNFFNNLYRDKRNYFFIGILIFCIVWEIFIIIGLLIDTTLIGTLHSLFDSSHSRTQLLFVLIAVGIFFLTGAVFSIKTMKEEGKVPYLRGLFLLTAWISFTIGALLDASMPLSAVTLIIIRCILISSALEFYLGFFPPEFLIKRVLKTQNI